MLKPAANLISKFLVEMQEKEMRRIEDERRKCEEEKRLAIEVSILVYSGM